jgi:hypothetical protein
MTETSPRRAYLFSCVPLSRLWRGCAVLQLETRIDDLYTCACTCTARDLRVRARSTEQICHYCHNPILGEVISAMGRVFHVDHFACATCREPLGTRNFYEVYGQCLR